MPRQYDSYGNYTDDDGATWVGVGPNAGQYYYGGGWHDFPPIGGGGSSSGITYTTTVDVDGSVTGIPGATYQQGSNGSVSIVSRPSTSGGSGGSSSPTNVYINQNPGELYQTIVSDGSDGYPAGTVYQVNQLTGAVTVKSRPPSSAGVNPADKNNDGLDDTTNMALGVYKYAGSPTGYAYGNGQPVWPNGAPYEGGTTGGSDLDLSNKISTGGVTYVWSNKENKYVPAPGLPLTSGPGSSSGGGSLNISTSVPRASSGGGGSVSSAPTRDYAAEEEQQGQIQERLIRLQNELKNDPNNPYLIMEQQQLALQAQQIANSQRNADAQLRRQNILDFENAVSDTDMAKLNARRLALGANGDVSIANLLRDTPDGFQANDAAAALLAEIRGQGTMAPVGGVAGAFGISGASTGTTGAPLSNGSAPAGGSSTSPQPGATQMTPVSTFDPKNYGGFADAGVVAEQAARAAAAAEDRITFDPKNYVALDAFHFKNTVSGKVYNLAEYTNILQQANGDTAGQMSEADQMATAIQNAQARAQMTSQIQGTPYTDPFANRTYAIGTYGTTLYNTPQGWTLTNQQASTKPQSGAESFIPGAMPYGNDNVMRPVEGNLANDNIQRGIDLPNKVITPMARGGVAYGAMVTGDSPSGRPTGHEELVIAPRGAMVIPMRRMAPVMRDRIMNSTQRFALGTFSPASALLSSWGSRFGIGDAGATQIADHTPLVASAGTLSQGWNPRRFVMQPVAQPISQPAPAAQPVTQPAAQQQPVAAQPAPVVTQPQQPAQNTMQPVQTQPTTAGGAPVTTTPAFDPANPVALTPEAIANLQEIRNFRDSQNNLAGIGLMDASFNRLAPTLRASALQQFQTRTGVPIQDVQFEQQRYALQGRGRAMLPVGY